MEYKILSLDGGGTWALIQARVLAERYIPKFGPDVTGHQILKEYDMVIANSGGSLVLAMLCADKKITDIIKTFRDVNVLQAIFKKRPLHLFQQKNGKNFLPLYETENKYEVFRTHLKNNGVDYGDVLLTDLPLFIGKPHLEIIITLFDYDGQRAVYFRSNRCSMMESWKIENAVAPDSATDKFKTITLARAVHGSSNAPVQYFNHPASFKISTYINKNYHTTETPRLYWDGAVGGNNNPVKAAVLEAMANGKKREDIKVVSIGTSTTIRPVVYNEYEESKPKRGQEFLCRTSKIDTTIEDLAKMASAILDDPPDAATFEAHQILGLKYVQNDKQLIRINPLVKPVLLNNEWTMPGNQNNWTVEDMQRLFTMSMAIATDNGIQLIDRLCDDFFDNKFDNQGIRIGGNKMEPILGHKTYSEAMNDWQLWDTNSATIDMSASKKEITMLKTG